MFPLTMQMRLVDKITGFFNCTLANVTAECDDKKAPKIFEQVFQRVCLAKGFKWRAIFETNGVPL